MEFLGCFPDEPGDPLVFEGSVALLNGSLDSENKIVLETHKTKENKRVKDAPKDGLRRQQ